MLNSEHAGRRRLLDAAAGILRGRTTPESPFYALLEGVPDSSLAQFSEIALPYTERLSHLADPGQPQVGDMPPQPPTFRARAGALLVSIVRRMLFWYTDQIRAQNRRIAEAAREQARVLHQLSESFRQEREKLEDVHRRLAGQDERMHSLREQAAREAHTAAAIKQVLAEQAAKLETASQAQASLREEFRDTRTRMLQQDLRTRMPAAEHAFHPAPHRIDDQLFVEHARAFRGDRAEIKRRLTVYLPYLQAAFAATGNAPALDLGCGRGEWLEFLSAAGIPAQGLDSNRVLIAECRERGLDAAAGDLPQSLYSIADASRSIVSAIHLVEHLSFPDLLELVDHTVRILKPGGIAIFETPNPNNLFVGLRNFYLDPTHQHPLPSEFLSFVVQARGLREPQIIPTSPYPDSHHLPESNCPAAAFINRHFFGPQDYGIVARKAALSSSSPGTQIIEPIPESPRISPTPT